MVFPFYPVFAPGPMTGRTYPFYLRQFCPASKIWSIAACRLGCYNEIALFGVQSKKERTGAAVSRPHGKRMKKILSVLLATLILMATFCLTAGAAGAGSAAGQVKTAGGRLNVRAGASTSSAVLTSLANGGYVTLISKSGAWWYVEYAKNRFGYAHGDYIRSVSGNPSTVQITSGSLNVRSGAGTSYAVIGSLSKGETVVVLSESGDWSRVLYHGVKTGYVSNRYLSRAGGDSAVSLRVPSYKQTDSRWANVKIGTSGKTIAQIGCATTAIAMMESYRTGRTIYPDAMAKQLRYTASGSVYWPEHYRAVTDTAGYLSAIYHKLKAGKPVLFGAKTTAGSQHWVVITGFTGGSVAASRFTVLDPGSNSRTNLQQFLNDYPVVYKYFYYV